MTKQERALQLWPLLVWCARHRQTLTYEDVHHLTGMATPGVGQTLGPIQRYCIAKKIPLLNALVVQKHSGTTGDGFIADADVPRAQASVFLHDWYAQPVPSLADLDNG